MYQYERTIFFMKKASQTQNNEKLTAEEIGENNELIQLENKEHFILIYESVYKNNELTADELALILKLSAAAPTFKPTKNKLMALLHISEHAFLKATKGLQEKGYLKIINKHKGGSIWLLEQRPQKQIIKKSIDEIKDDFICGVISWAQLVAMLKNKQITKSQYKEIIEETYKIAKTPYLND